MSSFIENIKIDPNMAIIIINVNISFLCTKYMISPFEILILCEICWVI